MTTSSTRKQIYDLVDADLEACAVWEFALDEEDAADQDEATVRPCPDLAQLGADEIDLASTVVRTDFRAADGTGFVGYCSPSYEDDLGYVQPTITTETAQVGFWFGMREPTTEDIARAYSALGKSAEALFPIQYSAFRPFSRLHAAGTIAGFMHLPRSGQAPVVSR